MKKLGKQILSGAALVLFLVVFFAPNNTVFAADCEEGTVPGVRADGKEGCIKPSFKAIGGLLDGVAVEGYGEENFKAIESKASLQSLIGKVINGALQLVGAIFLIMMVYGGYNWMLSRGDSEMVKKGEDTVRYAILGLIIVAGAYVLTNFVMQRLGSI